MERRDYVIGRDPRDGYRARNVGDKHPADRIFHDDKYVVVLQGKSEEVALIARALRIASAKLKLDAVTVGAESFESGKLDALAKEIDSDNITTTGLPRCDLDHSPAEIAAPLVVTN
ncbi:hypothetical protein COU14_00750 [Candidatus Kaiserbacteria bacterium CG10_big_fil_rev_8_21_14_0_10_44_10]|uniref:Uncharacterized protein n=1 Tax=Candidatus Kaiserbacteria bacterium CG10_big_fil_rev_8_21_14_0_10_44_10 TaxID=1974606 RepID=A0A2H0UK91_9BACT|nr:MAG: hypothetical protein COU14_00750 [Candidatus Kaiserbacteria bacterium CG10_big_fil_rev_8_21_14_0_10_44_10]